MVGLSGLSLDISKQTLKKWFPYSVSVNECVRLSLKSLLAHKFFEILFVRKKEKNKQATTHDQSLKPEKPVFLSPSGK